MLMSAAVLFALTAGARGVIAMWHFRDNEPWALDVAQLAASLFAAGMLGWQAVHPHAP